MKLLFRATIFLKQLNDSNQYLTSENQFCCFFESDVSISSSFNASNRLQVALYTSKLVWAEIRLLGDASIANMRKSENASV